MANEKSRQLNKPELLVPLNGWKSIAASTNVLKNADAVYFGITGKFSMRARAQNIATEEIPKLVQILHDNGNKAYLTTNILIYNIQLAELFQSIELAKNAGIDAIICHDLAAVMICKNLKIPFHISTQANISNRISAKFYESLGASRIILARELRLSEIQEIIQEISIPVEVFVHGAMCTAISGRCYFSSEIMGFNRDFSANQGKCVQPCRREYTLIGEEDEHIDYNPQKGLFFNAKDLCMIEHLPALIKAGIDSFKIEGRMRDPEYISTVTQCYREAIDSYFDNSFTAEKLKNWQKQLRSVFNRGFHTGYYFSTPQPQEISRDTRGNQSLIKRKMIGKVQNFYHKANAVEIEITSGSIKTNDVLIFENLHDFYHKQLVLSLQMDGLPIKRTPIASKSEHFIVGVAVDRDIPINARVYKLEDVSNLE